MRRLRKSGAIDPTTNEVVVIPRLPPVTGASKPPGWNQWEPAEKVEHLLGMSLDRMAKILSWPADGLDPYRLAVQAQVMRVVTVVGAKVGAEVEARRRAAEGIAAFERFVEERERAEREEA